MRNAMRLPRFFVRWLETGDAAATLDRMFYSRHVEDLRLIVAVCLWGVFIVVGLALAVLFETTWVNSWKDIKDNINGWTVFRTLLNALSGLLPFLTAVLAGLGAVLAWAYQAGSARLGVVDLFACEISTLCRVATVLETVQALVRRYEGGAGPAAGGAGNPAPTRFTSQESYFPVFDICARDLQALEARVVINITAFYTYMKAVRDAMRALSELSPPPAPAPGAPPGAVDVWHEGLRNAVYMLFLSLESARNAIEDLVEFEPELAERTIVILLSELEAYGFLRQRFDDPADVRHQRIALRQADYLREVPSLCRQVHASGALASGSSASPGATQLWARWQPARLLLPELCKRYAAATGSTDCEPYAR